MFFYLLRHYSTVFHWCAHSSSLALFPKQSGDCCRCRQQNKESCTDSGRGCSRRCGQCQRRGHRAASAIREAGALGLKRPRGSWKPEEILGLLQRGHSFFFPAAYMNPQEEVTCYRIGNACPLEGGKYPFL